MQKSRRERRGRIRKSGPFYVTFVVQNHQLNHLPPTDLKNKFAYWLRQSFVGILPKNPAPNVYRFLNEAARKFPTYIHTRTHRFIEILYIDLLLKIKHEWNNKMID